jgi:hypothetical protein
MAFWIRRFNTKNENNHRDAEDTENHRAEKGR